MDLKKIISFLALGSLALTSALSCAAHAAQVKVGFSQIGSESEWRKVLSHDVINSAKERNISLLFEDAQSSQEKQIEAIRHFIEEEVDLIGLVPIVSTGWDEILREAKKAKIPVLIVDRDLKVSDPTLYVTRIGTDSYNEGRKVFNFIDDYAAGHGLEPRNGGKKLNIALIEGTQSSSVTLGRKDGFFQALNESQSSGSYNILIIDQGDFSLQSGKAAMERIMSSYKDEVDVLFAFNDDMALGAIEAIEDAGLKPGKDIIIVSIDATKQMLRAIINGKANASIECNPLQGDIFFDIAVKILKSEFVPKSVFVEESVFTKSNSVHLIDFRKY